MTRLLITGASGLLGLNLALMAHALGYDVVGCANDSFMLNFQYYRLIYWILTRFGAGSWNSIHH
jgi:GDP-D-mannose dehydratase